MKILIIAATEFELAPLKEYCSSMNMENVDFCIAGVGTVATTFCLTRKLADETYDLLINIGICGSFNRDIELLQVLEITSEVFSDLGIETYKGFTPLYASDLLDENKHPYNKGRLINDNPIFSDLHKAAGSTSDTCHTSEANIRRIVEQFAPDTESMEGAAFFFVAKHLQIPFTQLRAVSNYVGERGEGSWKIKEAIQAVNRFAIDFLRQKAVTKI